MKRYSLRWMPITGIFLTNWVSHATSCSTISSFPNTGMRISSRHRTRRRKEVINRFSNGILVDEAIAKVEEDIVPLSEKKRQVELELAGLDGRIGMLQEQIRKEEEAGAEPGGVPCGTYHGTGNDHSGQRGSRSVPGTRTWTGLRNSLPECSGRTRLCRNWKPEIPHWKRVWKR